MHEIVVLKILSPFSQKRLKNQFIFLQWKASDLDKYNPKY